MNLHSKFYIGGESGPRKGTLDNLKYWLENPTAEKIKPLRGAHLIGKTVSINYLCEDCKFKVIQINWDDEEPEKTIDFLAEGFTKNYKHLPLGDKALPTNKTELIIDPYEKIQAIAKRIKDADDLMVKYTQLASLIEYYNMISKETVVLLVNSCRTENFKNEFKRLLKANLDNNIKVIFEKYEKDILPLDFSYAKLRKSYSETLFLDPPNYKNIKGYIKKRLDNVDIDCIIEYVGCHPAFIEYLCDEMNKRKKDLNTIIKRVKRSGTFDPHLNCYFNILKEFEPRLYKVYINHFMDVNKIDDDKIEEMIKWGLCYKGPDGKIKTPILFKDHIRDEIKFGNIKLDANEFKLKIIENYADFEKFEKLISESDTWEKEIHNLIENNLWLLGRKFIKLSSNQPLSNSVKSLGKEYKGHGDKDRPDLILTQDNAEYPILNLWLIELKRPKIYLNRKHEAQIKEYRDKLRKKFPNKKINMILIGGGVKDDIDLKDKESDLDFLSYQELVINVRNSL